MGVRFVKNYFFELSLTPGRSSGLPINSTPNSSKALFIASIDLAFPDGMPDISSYRLIVATPTPEAAANSSAVILTSCLAALICSEIINLNKI